MKFFERQWPGRGDPSIQELFPADAVASPRQKKKKKKKRRQDALFLLWEMVLCILKDLLIKLPSPQVSLFHSEERCAVVSRKDPGLSYAKLGESSWQVSPCTFWFSSVSCLGTSTTKEQSVFPGGGVGAGKVPRDFSLSRGPLGVCSSQTILGSGESHNPNNLPFWFGHML